MRPINRYRGILFLFLFVSVVMVSGGCSTLDRRAEGAILGATVGGIAGSEINGATGAVVGATFGAVVGYMAGGEFKKPEGQKEYQLSMAAKSTTLYNSCLTVQRNRDMAAIRRAEIYGGTSSDHAKNMPLPAACGKYSIY